LGGPMTCTVGGSHTRPDGREVSIERFPLVFVYAPDETKTAAALHERKYAYALSVGSLASDTEMVRRSDALLVLQPLEHWYTHALMTAAKQVKVPVFLSLDTLCAQMRM